MICNALPNIYRKQYRSRDYTRAPTRANIGQGDSDYTGIYIDTCETCL
jgi:hypothetical protein